MSMKRKKGSKTDAELKKGRGNMNDYWAEIMLILFMASVLLGVFGYYYTFIEPLPFSSPSPSPSLKIDSTKADTFTKNLEKPKPKLPKSIDSTVNKFKQRLRGILDPEADSNKYIINTQNHLNHDGNNNGDNKSKSRNSE